MYKICNVGNKNNLLIKAAFVVALRNRNFLNVSFTSSPISQTLVPYKQIKTLNRITKSVFFFLLIFHGHRYVCFLNISIEGFRARTRYLQFTTFYRTRKIKFGIPFTTIGKFYNVFGNNNLIFLMYLLYLYNEQYSMCIRKFNSS